MPDICFYAFFSDGLFEFAESFLDSLKHHHGDEIHLVLETRDLSVDQIARIKDSYQNLDLRNAPFDIDRYAQMLGVDATTILRWKHEVENVVTSDENYKWKILMSVEERYRSMPRIAAEARAAGFNILLHTDIDMYFRRRLDGLIDIVRNHDVSIRFREGAPEKMRVLGAYMGFSLNDASEKFLDSWARHIDAIPPMDKPRGYGQTSFYRAYLEHQEDCRWGRLDQLSGSPVISKSRDPEADIWVGNSNQGRNRKQRSAHIFSEDLKEMQRDAASHLGSASYRTYHFPSHTVQSPSASFREQINRLRKKWLQQGTKTAGAEQVVQADIFFAFLTRINALLQLNSCSELLDFASPNANRFSESNILKDDESGRQYAGAASYLGINVPDHHSVESEESLQREFEAVCVAGVLEHCSQADIPWLVDEAFRLASHVVIFIIDLSEASQDDFAWWQGLIAGAANRAPGVNYKLFALQKSAESQTKLYEAQRDRIA